MSPPFSSRAALAAGRWSCCPNPNPNLDPNPNQNPKPNPNPNPSPSPSPHPNQVELLPLVCGVVVSRVGLWLFDLSVSQLFQESVSAADRGAVGAALEARHACAQAF